MYLMYFGGGNFTGSIHISVQQVVSDDPSSCLKVLSTENKKFGDRSHPRESQKHSHAEIGPFFGMVKLVLKNLRVCIVLSMIFPKKGLHFNRMCTQQASEWYYSFLTSVISGN